MYHILELSICTARHVSTYSNTIKGVTQDFMHMCWFNTYIFIQLAKALGYFKASCSIYVADCGISIIKEIFLCKLFPYRAKFHFDLALANEIV